MIINFQFMQYSCVENDDLLSFGSFVTFYDDFEG